MSIMELLFNGLWQFLKESISFSLIKYEKTYFSLTKTRMIIYWLCSLSLLMFHYISSILSLVAHFCPDDASCSVSN